VRASVTAMDDPTTRQRCPAVQGIEVLQEKWVLHIVHALLAGPRGFNAIGREVGGCNPTTLTQRLTRLETLGLIVKSEGDGTCRACYRLTEAGAQLDGVIGAIHRWADAHLGANGAPHEGQATPAVTASPATQVAAHATAHDAPA
jgi:DNA-binding HxlR family transcriptional regulator